MKILESAILIILAAAPAVADPLPGMAGKWSGSGTARPAPEAPEEAVRCQLENVWQEASSRLRISGRCAVPGRRFDIDGALARRSDGKLRGFWANPDGPGQTDVSGRIEDRDVLFTFSATDPSTGADVSQTVRWRLEGDSLQFMSWHRDGGAIMADITFNR